MIIRSIHSNLYYVVDHRSNLNLYCIPCADPNGSPWSKTPDTHNRIINNADAVEIIIDSEGQYNGYKAIA